MKYHLLVLLLVMHRLLPALPEDRHRQLRRLLHGARSQVDAGSIGRFAGLRMPGALRRVSSAADWCSRPRPATHRVVVGRRSAIIRPRATDANFRRENTLLFQTGPSSCCLEYPERARAHSPVT